MRLWHDYHVYSWRDRRKIWGDYRGPLHKFRRAWGKTWERMWLRGGW